MERHALTIRQRYFQRFRMQKQAIAECPVTVQRVTNNRVTNFLQVHTQLVGAACLWAELNQAESLAFLQKFVVGRGRLAIWSHSKGRGRFGIALYRHVDGCFWLLRRAFDDSNVCFLYFSLAKFLLEPA